MSVGSEEYNSFGLELFYNLSCQFFYFAHSYHTTDLYDLRPLRSSASNVPDYNITMERVQSVFIMRVKATNLIFRITP